MTSSPPRPDLEPVIYDRYTYEQVEGAKCSGKAMENVCRILKNLSTTNQMSYFIICVAIYNEEKYEFEKTVHSLVNNFNWMKNTLSATNNDIEFQKELARTVPLIVPIFDGVLKNKNSTNPNDRPEAAMSNSMRSFLIQEFPELKEELQSAFDSLNDQLPYPPMPAASNMNSSPHIVDNGRSGPGKVEVCGGLRLMSWSTGNPSLRKCDEDMFAYVLHPEEVDSTSHSLRANSATMDHASTGGTFDSGSTISSLTTSHGSQAYRDDATYGSEYTVRTSPIKVLGGNGKDAINYFLFPIIKRTNRRKHNTHDFFFKQCQELSSCVYNSMDPTSFIINYCMLTDCGTTYHDSCLFRLWYALFTDPNLIGATARQRVETPNMWFCPCKQAKWNCFKGGDHNEPCQPCWKCWLCYNLSPCRLQGFEFEATLVTNTIMFNLVEALPVMPGPCQIFRWKLMEHYQVPKKYLEILAAKEKSVDYRRNIQLNSRQRNENMTVEELALQEMTYYNCLLPEMRLAEDRILSFVAVFLTGLSTKWIPGATFYYEPCVTWQDLLKQRRRWINGTAASFLFYFTPPAKRLIRGAEVNWKKNIIRTPNMVFFMWGMQLFQLGLVVIAPSVFGAALYMAVNDLVNRFTAISTHAPSMIPTSFPTSLPSLMPTTLNSTLFANTYVSTNNTSVPSQSPTFVPTDSTPTQWTTSTGVIGVAEWVTGGFFLLYAVWMFYSHYHDTIPEWISQCIAMISGILMLGVYASIVLQIDETGFDFISSFILVNILQPMLISGVWSPRSALFYLINCVSFLFLIIFQLVFIPTYAFARLWDTTWGNRDTGKDQEMDDIQIKVLKRYNYYLNFLLIALNIALCFLYIYGIHHGGQAFIITFTVLLFSVLFVQIFFCFVYIIVEAWSWFMPKRKIDRGAKIQITKPTNYHNSKRGSKGIGKRENRISFQLSHPVSNNNNSFLKTSLIQDKDDDVV